MPSSATSWTRPADFQTCELGRVNAGGGGTIAYIMAKYGMNVIDSALLSCPCTPCGRSPSRPISTRHIAATRPSSSALIHPTDCGGI
ncbi:MAG: hypothetical protein ACLU0O_05290 [Collinsella sp.]